MLPLRIHASPSETVRSLTEEKRMRISDRYWSALKDGTDHALFAQPHLLAANAIILANRPELEEKFTQHAFTENHGGRWIRLVAEERGGDHRKIMLRHADDEERHGLLFLKLLRSLGYDVSDSILGPSDRITEYYMDLHHEWGSSLFNFLCFVHAAEIRTLYHVLVTLHVTAVFDLPEFNLEPRPSRLQRGPA